MNAPQIEQEARHEVGAAEAGIIPASPVALPWKPVLAVAVAALAGAIVWAGLSVPAALPAADHGESLAGADLMQLERNREALESAGLAAGGQIYVRDFAAEDGDAVLFNGATIPLTRRPTPLVVTPGPLVLSAVLGATGCVTVEIGDGAGVYQLCLRDGDPIKTRAR